MTGLQHPDRVVLTEAGVSRELTVAEFFQIPVDRQVEFLIKGAVIFFSGATQLRTLEALKVLRAERARSTAAGL